MWEAIKTISSVILFLGIVIALATTIFVFSWVFKIIGFVLAVFCVMAFFMWVIWELASGWWEDRKNKG